MWLFTNFGYLLPTLTTETDPMRKHEDWDKYSVDGKFTFQIRARLSEHLDYYLENFAEEGTYGPIWRTPDHDYNYRVFTTQEAFAIATAKMVMAIDYRNFKDQSTKFPRGKEYHDLLLRIWSASCDLGEGPGGFYGPRTAENPKGFGSVRSSNRWSTGEYEGRRIGDTFENIDFGDGTTRAWEEDDTEEFYGYDYRAESIIAEMDELNIPMSEWSENLLPSEFNIVKKELRKAFSRKAVKQMEKRNKSHFAVV